MIEVHDFDAYPRAPANCFRHVFVDGTFSGYGRDIRIFARAGTAGFLYGNPSPVYTVPAGKFRGFIGATDRCIVECVSITVVDAASREPIDSIAIASHIEFVLPVCDRPSEAIAVDAVIAFVNVAFGESYALEPRCEIWDVPRSLAAMMKAREPSVDEGAMATWVRRLLVLKVLEDPDWNA